MQAEEETDPTVIAPVKQEEHETPIMYTRTSSGVSFFSSPAQSVAESLSLEELLPSFFLIPPGLKDGIECPLC